MATRPSPRKSAEERREEILAVAKQQFAAGGYRGTSTEAIARDAGISQPYLFRLFRTKKELFLACYDRACDHVVAEFGRAAEGAPAGERLMRMGRAYVERLLPDRHTILLLLQGYAAAGSEPDVQAHVRDRYRAVVEEVTRLSGAAPHEVWRFFATGMLLNVVAALDLASIADEDEWAAGWTRPGELLARD